MSISKVILIVSAIISVCSSSTCSVETETLCINQVNEMGFGDTTNKYAFAMVPFKGSLYVATLNAVGGLPTMALFFLGQAFPTNGVQIHKGDRNDETNEWQWTRVVTDGNGNSDNYGIRKLIVVGEYLYGVTTNHVSGFEVWRTFDGENWEIIVKNGFGDIENTSGRGLATFDGYLYVGSENRNAGAKIWRRAVKEEDGDFDEGDWEKITTDGFGDTSNIWFSDFKEYNGWLYAGTLNVNYGMELWRTNDGINFEKVFDEGNGDRLEFAAMKLFVYNDKLYIGTMNFLRGASLYVNVDDEGMEFESIFINGNGDRKNSYIWYMEEFNGRLYAATFTSFEEFDLFSSTYPVQDGFITETQTGFDNEGQYGIRSMAVFEGKLMIGSATAGADLGCIVWEADVSEGNEGRGRGERRKRETVSNHSDKSKKERSTLMIDFIDKNLLIYGLLIFNIVYSISAIFYCYIQHKKEQYRYQSVQPCSTDDENNI